MADEILIAAGKMSNAARGICGGRSFSGFSKVKPCSIEDAGHYVKILRECVDRYDSLILEEMRKEKV